MDARSALPNLGIATSAGPGRQAPLSVLALTQSSY